MKRIIGSSVRILSISSFLLLAMAWGESFVIDRSETHHQIPTPRWLGGNLHVLIRKGEVSFFDQFDVDPKGEVRPLIVDPLTRITPKVIRSGQLIVPGIDAHFAQFADGYAVWSLKASLLIPIGLML